LEALESARFRPWSEHLLHRIQRRRGDLATSFSLAALVLTAPVFLWMVFAATLISTASTIGYLATNLNETNSLIAAGIGVASSFALIGSAYVAGRHQISRSAVYGCISAATIIGAAQILATNDWLRATFNPLDSRPALSLVVATSMIIVQVAAFTALGKASSATAPPQSLDPTTGTAPAESPVDHDFQRSPRRTAIEVGAIVLAAALLILPSCWFADDRLVGIVGDADTNMWLGWRFGEAFRMGDLSGRFTDVFAPFGYDAFAGDGSGPFALMGLLNLIVGSPVRAYNLTLLLAIATYGLGVRQMTRTVGARSLVSIVAAVGAMASPIVGARLFGHPQLAFGGVALFAVAEALRGSYQRPVRPLRLGGWLVAAFLCGFGVLVAALVAVGSILLANCWGTRSWRDLAKISAVAGVVLAIGMSPFLWARFSYASSEAEAANGRTYIRDSLIDDSFVYSVDLATFAVPPEATPLGDAPMVSRGAKYLSSTFYESSAFLGFLAFVGLGALVITRSSASRATLAAIVALLIVGLGPAVRVALRTLPTNVSPPDPLDPFASAIAFMPFALVRLVSGLESFRTPGRVLLLLPGLCSLGLVAFDQARAGTSFLKPIGRKSLVVCAAVVVGMVAITASWPIPSHNPFINSDIAKGAIQMREQSTDDERALVIPTDCTGSTELAALITRYQRETVGCVGPYAGVRWYEDAVAYVENRGFNAMSCDPTMVYALPTQFNASTLPDSRTIETLRQDFGVRYLVVNRRYLNTSCPQNRSQAITSSISTFGVIAESPDVALVDLGSATEK